jgi:hypothetical protein
MGSICLRGKAVDFDYRHMMVSNGKAWKKRVTKPVDDHEASQMPPDQLCRNCGCSFRDLLLEWLFDDAIANVQLTPCEDKTAHPAPPLQRFPSSSANRLLHPRAGIARSFDEDAHLANADPSSDQVV